MAYDLYVITDDTLPPQRSHQKIAEEALAGGADVIQLRDKRKSGRELLWIAEDILSLTRKRGALFIMNDRMDIAIAAGADGVHLGQDDLPLTAARRIRERPFIIGISVASVDEAIQAEKDGADYVAVGPIFATQSKQDAGPGLGIAMLRNIRRAVSLPVIVIGGIQIGHIPDLRQAGADGIAVISAIVCSPDITIAAEEMKQVIRRSPVE